MGNFYTPLLSFLLLANSWEASHGLLRGKKQRNELKSKEQLRKLQQTMDRLVGGRGGSAYGTMVSITPLLAHCETTCTTDYSCKSGLVCFPRTQAFQAAPGCSSSTSDSLTNNYCVYASDLSSPTPRPIGSASFTAAPATAKPTTPAPVTPEPSPAPTPNPTLSPIPNPTKAPTQSPTRAPTANPTVSPTPRPTPIPTTASPPTPGNGGRGNFNTIVATVQNRLASVGVGSNEVDSDGTYQSKAVLRMAEIYGIESASDAKLVQFYVLYCIFEATNGVSNWIIASDSRFAGMTQLPGWLSTRGWVGSNRTLSRADPCKGWHGITCDSQGKVTEIELAENLLTGHFPPEVVWLASDGSYSTGAGNLNVIDLYKNGFLTNQEGDNYWWWSSLGSNFEYLLLGETAFGDNLGRLPVNLIEFDCSYSFFIGGLSENTFAGLRNLKYAVLDGNFFDVPIPKVLGQLPELRFLYAADSAITGGLSFMAEGMPNIVELWIDLNPSFVGSIPTQVGSLTTLQSLSLTGNTLTGRLPTQLGMLTNLKQLWLYDNSFSGPIPSQLGNLRRMSMLQLEANNFSGVMPDEVCSNYDGGVFGPLDVLGADCSKVDCDCCTCCSYIQCNR